MAVRINKYLAGLGIAARRKVDDLVASGKVFVNGKKAVLGQKVEPGVDKVEVNGKKVEGTAGKKVYIALNKPVGVVSTARDTHGRKTVLDLVESTERLFPVGRLDQDSGGLMLLTNDGDLAFSLTHPKFHIEKTYEVWVKGKVGPEKIGRLATGVRLDDGVTAPAKVKLVRETEHSSLISITLFQGKNRQIRRMCAALRLHITSLTRKSMGPVELGDLGSGKWRNLSLVEIKALADAHSI